LNCVRLIFTF